MMFKDETLETVNIKSDVLSEKYVRDQSCQTKPIDYKEKSSQVVCSVSIECQTESDEVPQQLTRMQIDNSKNLANFILKVYPTVIEQLTANLRSHAFDDYDLVSDERDGHCEPTYTHNLVRGIDSNLLDGLKVTALSWNSIGSTIAVAYGMLEHDSWCTHQSVICLTSITRRDHVASDDNQFPDKVIDVHCCVTSIAFNPHQPALLAGGNFSGQISVWDFSKEENYLVAETGKDTISHNELVNDIVWLPSPSQHVHSFASVGSDGNILIWSYHHLRQELKLTKSFLLLSDLIPRASQKSTLKNGIRIGVTCLGFHSQQNNVLFIGTETGCVLKCSEMMSKDKEVASSFAVQSYEGHDAIVNSIDCSRHDDDLFITAASDMCIHIYSTIQKKPIHKLDPFAGCLYDVKWSPTWPGVFYASTSSGKLFTYKITDHEVESVSSIQVCKDRLAIHKIALNKHKSCATGINDTVKIWKFSDL